MLELLLLLGLDGEVLMKTRSVNQVRIIAGQYRRRLIRFSESTGVRPTHDRVRETLFDWLYGKVDGAKCLDLFAGSGALGFEALSRGAAETVFVDNMRENILKIEENAKQIGIDHVRAVCCNALHYPQKESLAFDLIFLDPPYEKQLLLPAVKALEAAGCLHAETWIYVESEKAFDIALVCPRGQWLKQKTTKHLRYGLGRLAAVLS